MQPCCLRSRSHCGQHFEGLGERPACFYGSRAAPCAAIPSTLLLRNGCLALLDVWTAVDYWLPRGVGRGCGVGRGLGVILGIAVGVTVGVAVAVGVGVGVGAPDCAQYLPPVSKKLISSGLPPQTII